MQLKNPNLQFKDHQIAKINELRNCKWVVDYEHKGVLMSVFYQYTPPEEYTNYFALYYRGIDPRLMITDGSWIESCNITGIEADNGDVVFSHYRHHYNISDDASVWIDGGPCYIRYGTAGRLIGIHVKDDTLEIQ